MDLKHGDMKKMVDWNNIQNFERFPNLAKDLENVGDSRTVKFLDEGEDIKAEVLQQALVQKGKKNIKARDSIMFVVEDKSEKKEVWVSATNYTNLRELKAIRDMNGNSLVNAMVKVTRASKDDMTESSFKFEKA